MIKIWKLTPEQMAAYKPGMDLGEPDRVETQESALNKDGTFKDHARLGSAVSHRGRPKGRRADNN